MMIHVRMPIHEPPIPIDRTEKAMNEIVRALKAFDDALEMASIDRCHQLHDRLFALAQIVEATDVTVKMRWDDLLSKGQDY